MYGAWMDPMIGDSEKIFPSANAKLKPALSQLRISRQFGVPVSGDVETAELVDKGCLMSEGIKLFHEGDTKQVIDSALQPLQEAKQVFFLGFGFLKENMEKLGFISNSKFMAEHLLNKTYFASSFGMTDSEWRGIRNRYFPRATFPHERRGTSDQRISIDCLKLLRTSAEYLR